MTEGSAHIAAPDPYTVVARNEATASENKIHDDTVAANLAARVGSAE